MFFGQYLHFFELQKPKQKFKNFQLKPYSREKKECALKQLPSLYGVTKLKKKNLQKKLLKIQCIVM